VNKITKTAVIALLGTSPPVITEFVDYVEIVKEKRVSDLIIITTKEQNVLEGIPVIEYAIKNKYPHIHLHVVKLPFVDIFSDKENLEFMQKCAEILKEQKDIHKADYIYLCIAGGRKDMCITLSLLAQFFKINGVFHIITPNVKSMNEELERARYNIKELNEVEDKDNYYKQHKEMFDNLMFPHRSQYNIITIPILPYPQEILEEIINIFNKQPINKENIKISDSILKNMESLGLIILRKEKIIFWTNEGKKFSEILKVILN